MDFDIGEVHPNTPHLFADLAELILIIGYNGRKNLNKNDILNAIETSNISPDELDQEDDAEEDADINYQSSAEKNSRIEKQIEDVLTQLSYRSRALEAYYPFNIDGDTLILLDKDQLTDKQRIYRFLLACSRLRSFSQKDGIRQRWAKYYTYLSREAMRGLFPSYANVRIFDANSDDRKNYYSTNLKHATKILGKDLSVQVNEVERCKLNSSGDLGIDLVAVINFDDGASSSYALLGQCGAQETCWPKKTLEAHPINLRHIFQWTTDLPCAMFTPVCYRTADGEWAENKSANSILLIDRERILNLIGLQNSWHEITNSSWFINFETEFNSLQVVDC